ncbi:MAG: sigma-70 family RNA polymerase sigma factor [Acetobacter sp.]
MPELRAFARYLACNRVRADDLVQDAVMRALSARSQFVPGTSLKAWVFTILRNLFFEQERRRRREKKILEDEFMQDAVVQDMTGRENLKDLERFLGKLPDLARESLILVAAYGMSHEEIAQISGVTVGTIKARVSRARALLKTLMDAAIDYDAF